MMPLLGKTGTLGKLERAMPTILVMEVAGAYVDPVVLEQLDANVAVAEKVYEWFAGGDGAGAFLLDRGGATVCRGSVPVGGRDGQLAIEGFRRENWTGWEWSFSCSTTPCVAVSSFKSSDLLTVISMAG